MAGGGAEHSRGDSGIGWPRVRRPATSTGALRFEQEFEVTITVTEVTRRTISYACLITQGNEKVATAGLTIACVRQGPQRTMKSIDIPTEIAERFQGNR